MSERDGRRSALGARSGDSSGAAGDEPRSAAAGGAGKPEDGFFARVYRAVREVPPGRVTTYGTVSEMVVGHGKAARTVGWALRALPASEHDSVPWWRVINAAGRISTSNRELPAEEQRSRLEAEGVRFDSQMRTDLERYGWWG